MKHQTYDGERVSFNLARLRTHGEVYEVVVDPDLAIAFRAGKEIELAQILKAEHIFFDAKKGELASEERQKEVFGSSDPEVVAKEIILKGEIQMTAEFRDRIRKEKLRRILEIIHTNAVDPKTKLPHPLARLENAIEQANIHIDEHKRAEDQVNDILKQLSPILPIRFETRLVQLHVPANYAAKLYSTIKSYGQIKKESWLNDGSWLAEVELPAGLHSDMLDDLNGRTHGSVECKILN